MSSVITVIGLKALNVYIYYLFLNSADTTCIIFAPATGSRLKKNAYICGNRRRIRPSTPTDGRQADTRTAAQVHVQHPQPQHQARGIGAQIPVCTRVPFPHQRPPPARHARHRAAQVPHGHLRQRLLLARPRRLPLLRPAQNQHRLLASQNRAQPRARPLRTPPAPPHGLARHPGMGVPAQTQKPRTDPEKHRPHPEPHLPGELFRPQGETVCRAGRRQRRGDGGGQRITSPPKKRHKQAQTPTPPQKSRPKKNSTLPSQAANVHNWPLYQHNNKAIFAK